MDSFKLKVDSNVMRKTASEVSGSVKKVEKQWRDFEETIKRSKSYWQGEASNEHQQYYLEIKDEVNTLIKRLKEHPDDLLKMAGLYEETEKEIQEEESSLPDDVILN